MERAKEILVKVSSWSIEELDEFSILEDLKGALIRGDHKSAKVDNKFPSDALVKENKKGWELLLHLKKALDIPGLVLSPMGVAKQLGVNLTEYYFQRSPSVIIYPSMDLTRENQ